MEQQGILIPEAGNIGSFREARIVAMDPGTDLALLKITGASLPALRIGDSDMVKEGQPILMSGFPIGSALGPFVATHRGIIAAIAPIAIPRRNPAVSTLRLIRRLAQGHIQHLPTRRNRVLGNSGGPIYDAVTEDVFGIVDMVLLKATKEAANLSRTGVSPTPYRRST